MDYISKFSVIVPAVGKLRALVMKKILPMAMEALEYAYIGVRNVIVSLRRFLGQTYSDSLENLLIEINKKGPKVCVDSTSMGKSLSNEKVELMSTSESSIVLLQAMFEIQECANKECPSRNQTCFDCWKFNNSFGNVLYLIQRWKEGMQLCSIKMDKFIDRLNVTAKINAIFDTAFNTTTEIDQFLKIVLRSLAKSAKSIDPLEKHLLACCPCARPNRMLCDQEAIKNSTRSITCPLELLVNFKIFDLLQSVDKNVEKLRVTLFSDVILDNYIPPTRFEINVPKYFQECFGSSSFKRKFTKLCSLPTVATTLRFRSLIYPILKHSFIAQTYSSLQVDIDQSCTQVNESFEHFGRTMTECDGRIAMAISNCKKHSYDPDPGVDYCPCQIPTKLADEKQPYCVVSKRSVLMNCSSHCLNNGFKPGKNPTGDNAKMNKTYGYPVCDNLKYYCKISDVSVKNGNVKCDSEYIFHNRTCQIVPNPGFICPVHMIECSPFGYPIKGVCWNYPVVECVKDDVKRYSACTCNNNYKFNTGKILCQYGNFQGVAPTTDSALELRKTFNCFERLGLDEDIKKDCGASMSPCVIQTSIVNPYKGCKYASNTNQDSNNIGYILGGSSGGVLIVFVLAIMYKYKILRCPE
ncbi:uncharacterized protein LOC110248011 [Exaiptasia diaphana]|uniref:Uncharacterized protein n=1 Tax=Exaiptasia diaphana TaxID=2652724 RepID=A0A913YUA3_EXADI|nr:uncharacterized protein LOC110248011 [Exaiptasia diaphana]KXJ08945.1 hypothetical protein AC249_AIPGENE1934 [Exaiptasia diaphana]